MRRPRARRHGRRGRARGAALALLSAAAGIAAAAWVSSASGCATIVGADFDDKALDDCTPCYTGPPQTEGRGMCVAGCQEGDACRGEVTPVIEDCATEDLDESCDGTGPCDGGNVLALGFGDPGDQSTSRVAVDRQGDMILAAEAQGDVDYGGGTIGPNIAPGYNVHVAKLDPAGAYLWSKSFGGGTDHRLGGLAVDTDGTLLLSGYFAGSIDLGSGPHPSAGEADAFVAKLDPSGNHVWSATFGDGPTQLSSDLAVDPQHNVVLCGWFLGGMTFNNALSNPTGLADVFVAKLSPDGVPLWGKQFGDAASDQYSVGVAAGPGGVIAVTGLFAGAIDFGGGPFTSSKPPTLYDGFVAVLGPSGAHVFSHALASDTDAAGIGVAFDVEGNLYVTGRFKGTTDFGGMTMTSAGDHDAFLVAYDPNGAVLWARQYGDATAQVGHSVALDAAGNLLLGGYGSGAIDFGAGALPTSGDDDAFVAKLDRTGAPIWARIFGNPGAQITRVVAPDPLGNVIATGYYDAAMHVGDTPLPAQGQKDIWLAKLRP